MPITNDNNDVPPGILHVYVFLSYTIKFCYVLDPMRMTCPLQIVINALVCVSLA